MRADAAELVVRRDLNSDIQNPPTHQLLNAAEHEPDIRSRIVCSDRIAAHEREMPVWIGGIDILGMDEPERFYACEKIFKLCPRAHFTNSEDIRLNIAEYTDDSFLFFFRFRLRWLALCRTLVITDPIAQIISAKDDAFFLRPSASAQESQNEENATHV